MLKRVLLFVSLFCTAIAVFLQSKQFHEEVKIELVNVYLSATDKRGNFVTDLHPEELSLLEDGMPQQITNFARSSTDPSEPITVVILIDTSLSMNEEFEDVRKIEMAKRGALLVLDQLRRDDKMLLIQVSDIASDLTGVISDKKRVKQVIRSLKADSGLTALLDAVDLAIEKVKGVTGQKLIFICSDGEDTASKRTVTQTLDRLKSNFEVTMVALGINALQASGESEMGQRLRDGRTLLQSLADTSGGYTFFPRNLNEVDYVMQKLAALIPGQYFVGYRPTNSITDGSWRSIQISCSRPGVKLKSRTGYFSR